MARPQKPLDDEKVFKLARRQWTAEEIGSFFDVSGDTIKRRYGDLLEIARHAGKAKLKDALWRAVHNEKERSDKLFIHALNRFVGPIPKDIKIDLTKLTDEELAGVVSDRLGGFHAASAQEPISDVFGTESAKAPPPGDARSEVPQTKRIRLKSSALSGRSMLKARREK